MTKYIVIAIVVIICILLIWVYNTLISKRNKLRNAYSSLDVMLKRRYDLIPNIVETVKGYAKHEVDTFARITEIRTKSQECKNAKDMEQISSEYGRCMSSVKLLSERYPDLRASDNFIHLQKVLVETEEQISAARRTYNAHVESFNTYVSFFPINLIAPAFGFNKYDYFEIAQNEKEVNVEF